MREYGWVPLMNSPYSEISFNIKFEHKFLYALKNDFKIKSDFIGKDYFLWSISADKEKEFIKACQDLGIWIKEIDLQQSYIKYLESNKNFVCGPTQQPQVSKEDMLEICSKTFLSETKKTGGRQKLYEFLVAQGGKKDNIKLYINAKEQGHNIPHCHVQYNEHSNYCCLSLINCEKIKSDDITINRVVKNAITLLEENLQIAREKWNSIGSPVKFKYENGEYTKEIYFVKKDA